MFPRGRAPELESIKRSAASRPRAALGSLEHTPPQVGHATGSIRQLVPGRILKFSGPLLAQPR